MPLGVAGHAHRRSEAADPRLRASAERLPRRSNASCPADVNALDEIGIQPRGVWDGVFTAAQADARQPVGRRAARAATVRELAGTDRAPALKGPAFLANWEDGSVNRLFAKIRDTMPPGNTDSLAPEAKLDIVAYLLRENGFPAGHDRAGAERRALDACRSRRRAPTPARRISRSCRWSAAWRGTVERMDADRMRASRSSRATTCRARRRSRTPKRNRSDARRSASSASTPQRKPAP